MVYHTSVCLISKTVTTRLSPSQGSTLKLEISCFHHPHIQKTQDLFHIHHANPIVCKVFNFIHSKEFFSLQNIDAVIKKEKNTNFKTHRHSRDLSLKIGDAALEEDGSGVCEHSSEALKFRDSEILQIWECTPRASL